MKRIIINKKDNPDIVAAVENDFANALPNLSRSLQEALSDEDRNQASKQTLSKKVRRIFKLNPIDFNALSIRRSKLKVAGIKRIPTH